MTSEHPTASVGPTEPDAQLDPVLTGHSHGSHQAPFRSSRVNRVTVVVLVSAAVLIAAAMALLWPHRPASADRGGGTIGAQGVVRAIDHLPCPANLDDPTIANEGTADCGTVDVYVTGGAGRGRVVKSGIPGGPGAPRLKVGTKVVLLLVEDDPNGANQYQYEITDVQRGTQRWILALSFAVAVTAFGRLRGLTALAGLAATFAILLYFIVPAILAGRPPLAVAIVGSAAIMLTVLYLTHGLNVSTSIAVIGTLVSLCLTGALALLATAATGLNGMGSEEATFLNEAYRSVDMRGLLLAGIIIGALGVLDDVAVTQAFTVAELAAANGALTAAQLYRAASRVGRAHIASVVNTIVLAYAGASLPLLLLLAASDQPVGALLTSPSMAQEIVRSIVGTIGLIAAVPITTGLAAFAARRTRSKSSSTKPNGPDERIRRTIPSAMVPPRGQWSWHEPDPESL